MRVLNVGGNSKDIPIPEMYAGWEHHLLDIDPLGNPDILCDAMELKTKVEYRGKYNAVYCSHNLEHYYLHKVPDVLEGFLMVLDEGGWVDISVPHIGNLIKQMASGSLDLCDPLYRLGNGAPISAHDILYGWGEQMQSSGCDFFAHKCGFTPLLLSKVLTAAGFCKVELYESGLELKALAYK